MKKAGKVTLIVLSVLVGLFLLIAAFVSPIAEYVIEKNCKSWIGRTIQMDDLTLNLFTGNLTIEGIHFYEVDEKTEFVGMDTLEVGINPFKLISKEVKITHISLSNPRVRIVQGDSLFNFSDLLALGGDSDSTEVEEEESSPWVVGIYNIRLSNGQLSYEDEVRGSKWNLGDLRLKVPGIYFSGKATDAGLAFDLAEGGSLATKVSYDMEHSTYSVNLKLVGLALSNAIPYIKDFINITETTGTLDANVSVKGCLDELQDIDINGELTINNLSAKNQHDSNIASLKKLYVVVDTINPKKGLCTIDTILIDGLTSRFDLYKDRNNFSDLMKPSEKEEVKKEKEVGNVDANKPMNIIINYCSLKNSEFTFSDHTLPKTFEYTLTEITLDAKDFGLNKENNSASLGFQTSDGGFAKMKWEGSMKDLRNQHLNLVMKNINLKKFSPYSIAYFGYPLSSGVFSFTSDNRVNEYQLRGMNKVDIYNCRVEDKRTDIEPEMKVPLKTALYILRDKDDKILLDIPISGNVNSPEFSYKKLILKTLVNLLVKVAVSPVNFVAESLGLSGDKLAQIEFDPQVVDITSEQYDLYMQLATILKEKPEMILQLTQKVDWKVAVEKYQSYEMKRAYLSAKNPDINKHIPTEVLERIDVKSDDFVAFSDTVTKMSVDTIESRLLSLMERRNKIVENYYVDKMKIEKNRVDVRSLTLDSLRIYKGKDCYVSDLKME